MRGPDRPDAQPRGPARPRLGRIHDRVLDAVNQVSSGVPADRALRGVFSRARDLGARERAAVSGVVYGLMRSQARVDDRLERAAGKGRRTLEILDPPMKNRLRVLAYLAAEGATLEELSATDRYAAGRVPGLFERLIAGKLSRSKRPPLEALAVDLCLPSFMVRRLSEAFGEARTRAIGAGLDGRAPVTLRVGHGEDRAALAASLSEELSLGSKPSLHSPWGLILEQAADLGRWAPYREGRVELQDEGSQLIALAALGAEGEAVLDACAGAGGKTLTIAAHGAQASLQALDPEQAKLKELKSRARRAGVQGIKVDKGDLLSPPAGFEGRFDVVLVDAPCTGSGTLRRRPDLRWRLSEAELDKERSRQIRLLAAACRALKPGGRVIYATCSVFFEENEAVTTALLEQEPRLRPLPLSELWQRGLDISTPKNEAVSATGAQLAARFAATHEARLGPGPSEHDPDGFYLATFQYGSL